MTTEFNSNIAELEKQAKVEEQKKNRIFIPGVDENYWLLTSDGYGCDECEYDDGLMCTADEERLIRGNCFKTEEEVKWADEHRIVETELRNFVIENDPNPVTDKDLSVKYYIFYDCIDDIIDCSYNENFITANQIYASSPAILIDAITHIGYERLKKYYFGV